MGLKEVITQALEKGITEKDLEKSLLQKGYSKAEIDAAFGRKKDVPRFQTMPAPGIIVQKKPSESVRTVSFWEKLKLLFSSPSGFFDKVHEPGIGKSIVMFLIVGGLMALIVLTISIALSYATVRSSFFPSYGYSFIFIFIFLYGFLLGLSFIYAGLVHGTVKLFKGTAGYVETYNICMYGFIPTVILFFVPLVGLLAFIYSLVLMTFGIMKNHDLTGGKAFTAAFTPVILFFILIGILFLFVFLAFANAF